MSLAAYVIKFNRPEILHARGVRVGRLSYRRRRATVSDYGFNRIWPRYDRTSNYIFMINNPFRQADQAHREAAQACARSMVCWLRGPRYDAAFAPLQLCMDSYRGRLGRTVEPVAKSSVAEGVR